MYNGMNDLGSIDGAIDGTFYRPLEVIVLLCGIFLGMLLGVFLGCGPLVAL